MAAVAHKCSIERFALVNDFRARFLFRRLRHRRNHNLRIRKRPGGTQLECIESRWPTFRFGGGHGTGGSEQARARAPSDRGDDILLAYHRKCDGNRLDGRTGLDRPKFLPGVSGVSREFTRALSLKNQVAGGGENAAIGGDFFLDGPASRLSHGIPGDEAAEQTLAAFSRIGRGTGVRRAIGCWYVNQSGPRVVAHGPPVVNGPLPSATRRSRKEHGASGLKIDGRGPNDVDERFRGKKFAGLGIQHEEESVFRRGHGHVPFFAIDDHVGHQRSEEHTSELQSRQYLVCRLLLEKKKKKKE